MLKVNPKTDEIVLDMLGDVNTLPTSAYNQVDLPSNTLLPSDCHLSPDRSRIVFGRGEHLLETV